MRSTSSTRQGENTRAAHLPQPAVPQQIPVGAPVWRTAAFAYAGAAEHAELAAAGSAVGGADPVDNPSALAFASGVAALDGARLDGPATAEAFPSGAAAVTGVLLACATSGAHVVAPAAAHGPVRTVLTGLLARFGVETTFAEPSEMAAAMRPTTRLVWAEALSEPDLAVPDLPRLAALAHARGALLAVDASRTTPVVCRPLEHGADLVVHDASGGLGGHGDASGGVVVGGAHVMAVIRRVRVETGASLGPDDAFLLRRGLETLPLRVRRQCDTASVFAAALAKHPAVRSVGYPGLPQHPSHKLARRLFDAGPEGTRFGAVVTVTPHGGLAAGQALVDAVRLALVAGTDGGVRTAVAHAATELPGCDPAAVRFRIGLEDAADLVRDVGRALDTVARVTGRETGGRAGPAAGRAGTDARRAGPAAGRAGTDARRAGPVAGRAGIDAERAGTDAGRGAGPVPSVADSA
ncbi:trans-sulfuration enzyme family protein [Actinomadura rupiterrae]|uniref:trans-sulfuration enzyme family protein n=1 Tax=Actinomadura rupiterrae TaxID=559627 RepID=UPI0020A28393|nr:PLP-dependent transferase [Actinomadura rupiterrae]MCP2339789.1 cystathionine beta-lyase/cystathionine gamma-synthase [Actinomadura rupiterrae]